jgi:hypothetical protein
VQRKQKFSLAHLLAFDVDGGREVAGEANDLLLFWEGGLVVDCACTFVGEVDRT